MKQKLLLQVMANEERNAHSSTQRTANCSVFFGVELVAQHVYLFWKEGH